MAQKSAKEQIVTAAVATLHVKGFNAAGVQAIAAAARVPKGSIFNHFDNKEALGLEALDRYWQAGLEWLGTLDDPKVPPLKRLKNYFRGLTRAVEKRNYDAGCMIGNLALEMSSSSPPIRERLATIFAAWSRGIETCVREAQSDGSMRRDLNARTIANLLLNSWQGAAMRAKVNQDNSSFAEFENIFKAMTP